MTWEEAKDQIARTQGYTQWDMIIVEGVNVFGGLSQIEMLEEAAKLYAREACIGFLNYTMHGTVYPDPDSRFRIEKMMEGYNELLTSGEPSNDKNPVIPATIKSLVDKYCGATLSNKHKTWKSLHKAMESDLMAYAREVAISPGRQP